jgi:1-aminocyclopropane-1-carboxylate deaminase/D-cysteine desulfhydrase-like pyridoxal-dependent ACC family enzyme
VSGIAPLAARFPALARLPRAELGDFPSPVQRTVVSGAEIWLKRDDRCASPLGGNKARALEFLLGDVKPGDDVVTVGAAGSTHALATATYGSRLGARVLVGRWRQEMNDAASVVASRVSRVASRAPTYRTVAQAYAWAWWQRARGAKWIPAGGSSALGVIGHVNAGLELADQIDAGELPEPEAVVVPLGTGGTAAGLALAFAIAGRKIEIIAVRVVPRIVGRVSAVRHLGNRAAALIQSTTGSPVPRLGLHCITIEHGQYGGAYGRPTDAGTRAAAELLAAGVALDPTYSAKAFAEALAVARTRRTLFWLTFDSRILADQ